MVLRESGTGKPGVIQLVLYEMRRFLVSLLMCLAVSVAGCGGEEARDEPADVESATAPAGQAGPAPAPAAPNASQPGGRHAPLTSAERGQLRAIAATIDQVVDRFDATVRECDSGNEASCVAIGWAAVVAVLDWPPYYLHRIGARRRNCEPLASAATGIYGFNLGVGQLVYTAPTDDGTRQRDQLALVDGLRHVTYDLRSAAASGCR
jgi:hypothetical protein